MDLYFERHDGEAATIEDFLKVFEDVSGRDLQQFALWYHQAGTPNLTVSTSHDAAKARVRHRDRAVGAADAVGSAQAADAHSARLRPGRPRRRRHRAWRRRRRDGRERRHPCQEAPPRRALLRDISERPALSLNRGFSAPVTLSVEQRREDQFFLARHDSDPFSRWQAYNTLLTEALIAAFRNGLGGKPPAFAEKLVALAGVIAADERLEHAFRALALALPGEADIAREIGKDIDPDVDLRRAARRWRRQSPGRTKASCASSTPRSNPRAASAPTRRAPAAARCATRCSTISPSCPAETSLPPGISPTPPT